MAASAFVLPTGLVAELIAVLTGVATAALMAQPIIIKSGRTVAPVYSGFHDALPIIAGLAGGLLMATILISAALYTLTQTLDLTAFALLGLCGLALLVTTIVGHPAFFGFIKPQSDGQANIITLSQTIISLHIWGYGLYGVCIGFWLARRTVEPIN